MLEDLGFWTTDDVRFREAISYAIDYQELQNLFTAGYGRTPAAGFIPDGSLNYIKTRDLSFNSSQAIALYWNDYVQPYNKRYDGYVENPIHGILSYETFYGLHPA